MAICPPQPIAGCWRAQPLGRLQFAGIVTASFPEGSVATVAGLVPIRYVAYAVGKAESGRGLPEDLASNPSACNWSGECSVGSFQIFWSQHPQYDILRLLDPWYNTRAAAEISGGGRDWTPWTTFCGPRTAGDRCPGNGVWLQYLGEAQRAVDEFILLFGSCPSCQIHDPASGICVAKPCDHGCDPATGLCIPPPGPVPILEGALVTYDGAGGSVWVIVNGQRRRIIMRSVPGDVFLACGYSLSSIQSFPQAQVLAMPAGADITGPPDCPYGNPPLAANTNSLPAAAALTGLGLIALGLALRERNAGVL